MSRILVAYFSTGGTTKKAAEKMAQAAHGDLFEIVPQQPYAQKDLDWNDPKSRSSLEMKDKSSRPAIRGKIENMQEYDTILLGFPIWWYVAPTIVNTFLEQYDLSGKKIVLFATSGSSGMGNTLRELKESAPNAEFIAAKRIEAHTSEKEMKKWLQGLN